MENYSMLIKKYSKPTVNKILISDISHNKIVNFSMEKSNTFKSIEIV